MAFSDLERRSGVITLINVLGFKANYVKFVEDRPILSATKM